MQIRTRSGEPPRFGAALPRRRRYPLVLDQEPDARSRAARTDPVPARRPLPRRLALRVDHLVPLSEAWESGASGWTAARREQYANDQGAPATLVVVTARSLRDKAGRDPADWVPADPGRYCRYVGEWVATKLRWSLSADKDETDALKLFADGPCEETVVLRSRAPR